MGGGQPARSSGGIGSSAGKGDAEHAPLDAGHPVGHGDPRLDEFVTDRVDAVAEALFDFTEFRAQRADFALGSYAWVRKTCSR